MQDHALKCAAPHGVSYMMVPDPDSVDRRDIPFSDSNPLLFHVLTDLPMGKAGEEALLRLMEDGVSLAPLSQSSRGRSLVMPRDAAAGDDEYLFLTPLTTYSSSLVASATPAIALDARALYRASKLFNFRVRDLEPWYVRVESDDVNGEIYPDEIDEDDLTWQERDEYLTEARALNASDDLRCVADAGTISGKEGAFEVFEIYAAMVAGKLSAGDAFKEVAPYLPEPDIESTLDWCPIAAQVIDDSNLSGLWKDLFTTGVPAHERIIYQLWDMPPQDRPEVLYGGHIPLCCAALYRSASGEWLRPPASVCRSGYAALSPP